MTKAVVRLIIPTRIAGTDPEREVPSGSVPGSARVLAFAHDETRTRRDARPERAGAAIGAIRSEVRGHRLDRWLAPEGRRKLNHADCRFLLRWRVVESEDIADRSRNDEFFVGADDVHLYATSVFRDQVGVFLVARRVEFDAQKSQARANSCANDG